MKLCVSKLCVSLEEGRREEEGEEADGSAQPKTKTPHNDVGNKNRFHDSFHDSSRFMSH